MADDWRVHVRLRDEGRIHGLLDELRDARLVERIREGLERVVVTHDGPNLHVYADSEAAARQAAEVVRATLGRRAEHAELELFRWHEREGRWEPPEVPLPATPEEAAREAARREQEEVAESREAGAPLWEVRIDLPTRADAVALARRLEEEGLPVLRRFRYVLLGAESQLQAEALRQRLAGEVPAGARLTVEGSRVAVERDLEPSPFAIFGGLAQ